MTNDEAVKVLEDMKVKISIPKAAELQRKRNEAIDMAIEALSNSEIPNSSDTVYRQAAIDAVDDVPYIKEHPNIGELWKAWLEQLPSAEPEREGRLSNKKWIDFLVAQFDVSRTSAKDMLHAMMSVKREDNFKKQFSGAKMGGGA